MRTRVVVLLLATVCMDAGFAAEDRTSSERSVSQEVAIREEPLTLPHYVKSVVPGTERDKRPKLEIRRAADITYRTVVLENEYLRIQIVPELGGVIHRCVFKPTADDFFYYEDLGKEWYVFWKSGVKASFPWAEHGMVNWGQPASCRAYRRPDGSVTVAMWMEFSRNIGANQHGNTNRLGGYSVALLSQLVTLRPADGSFSITYRLVNPSPWRQGRRLWNDAFFPRNHTAKGTVQGFDLPPAVTTSELVYPCAYVSYHCGQKFRKWDPEDGKIGFRPDAGDSIFPWDIPFGYTGVYYPEVRVNRLRMTDPKAAPGAKIYVERGKLALREGVKQLGLDCNYNFIELWGGTDSVFEGVENWIGPGEAFQFTHTFGLARGIAKARFADERLAVSVDFRDSKGGVGVVTWRPVKELGAMLDGKALERGDARAAGCAPDRPAIFALPTDAERGVLILTADGQEVLRRSFPLEIPDDTSGHDKIRKGLRAPGDMRADQKDRNWGQSGAEQAVEAYPDGSADRGRVLYRLGRVDEALVCLKKATEADPANGEGLHLLGVTLLEKGRTNEAAEAFASAVKVRDSYHAARFYLAVLALAGQDVASAARELTVLRQVVPEHWEARLLSTYLGGSVAEARRLESDDPADPRAVWVLLAAAKKEGDVKASNEALSVLDALLKEPGAAKRLAEFQSVTKGLYVPPLSPNRAPPKAGQ